MNLMRNDTSKLHFRAGTTTELYGLLQIKGPDSLLSLPSKTIANHLNATLEIVLTENDYEELLLNGSWTGVLGMLQSGQIDMTMDAYYLSPDRVKAGIFVTKASIMMEVNAVSIIKTANNIRDIWDNLEFVHWQIWFMYVFTIFAICTTAVIFQKAVMREIHPYQPKSLKQLAFRYLVACTDIVFMQGTLSLRPSTPSCVKMIIWFFAVGAFLLGQTFLATLQTGLVVEPKSDLIDTVEDLLAKPEMEVMVVKMPEIVSVFENPVNDIEREIGKKIGHGDNNHYERSCESPKFNRLIQGTHVLLAPKLPGLECGEYFCHIYKNVLFHMSKQGFKALVHPAISKHLKPALREQMEDIFQRMFENGLYDYWMKTYHSRIPSCFDDSPFRDPFGEAENEDKNDEWVKPKLVKNSLQFLFVGYSLAGVTLFIELSTVVWCKLFIVVYK